MILDNVNHHLPVHFVRLAEEKKEEGNQLYKLKSYRDALAKYSEAIGELTKFHFGIEEILDMFLSQVFNFTPKKVVSSSCAFFFALIFNNAAADSPLMAAQCVGGCLVWSVGRTKEEVYGH